MPKSYTRRLYSALRDRHGVVFNQAVDLGGRTIHRAYLGSESLGEGYYLGELVHKIANDFEISIK